MKKPHKWAEVIKAWADGKPVQVRTLTHGISPQVQGEWRDVGEGRDPLWCNSSCEFRIKPVEPKVQWYATQRSSFGVYISTSGCSGADYPLQDMWHYGSLDRNGAIRVESVDSVITKLEFFTKDQVEQMLKEGQQ